MDIERRTHTRDEPTDAAPIEPDSVGRVGREVIQQVDLDRIAALVERRSASALLDELGAIINTLDGVDPQRLQRRGGIVGRLLGRDLMAYARSRQANDHVRIRLMLAERRAADVVRHVQELDEAIVHVDRQILRLREIAERGRGALSAFQIQRNSAVSQHDAMERRIDHLSVLITSWGVALAQMRLVRQYAQVLLERYDHVRHVVVPAWKRAVDAARDGAAIIRDGADGDVEAAAPLHDALTSLLQEGPAAEPLRTANG